MARLKAPGLGVRATVEWGPEVEAIVACVERENIQQMVMATHGYSGISRWRRGSMAERLLQSTNVPVLLVRAAEKTPDHIQQAMPCQRIVVPLDGSSIAEQVRPPVTYVAQALDAEIILFRVPIAHVSGSLFGDLILPLEGTLGAANEIDLIATCTHGRTGLARFPLGSVADRVLRAGHILLLLVRAKWLIE